MTRIILTYRGGSKDGQVEELALTAAASLLVGRDPEAQIQFHRRRDDIVGRRHARIAIEDLSPPQFALVDLNSRNGTFLNGRQIAGAAVLRHRDVIQLGHDGPGFVFEVAGPEGHSINTDA